jgi:carboxylesterase
MRLDMMKNQIKIIPGCEPRIFNGNKIGCLLLHGFSSSPNEMRLLGDHLKEFGYTVHIPLLAGHGISPKDLNKISWYDWFDSAKNELFNIRKKCDKVFVIGLSMGGSLALHLAAHYEINGVVALAAGLYLRNKIARIISFLKPLHPLMKDFARSDLKADVERIKYDKVPIRAISELLKLFAHLKDDLSEIYAPALIIYSTQDHVIDDKSALTIYQRLSSKDKRILKLKDSYHILTLDVEKEKIFSEVSNFINQYT